MFNDTKQNVAASSEYELSYLGGDRGDLGEGGREDKRLSEGSAAELKPTAREGKALEWSRVSTCSEHVASLPGWSRLMLYSPTIKFLANQDECPLGVGQTKACHPKGTPNSMPEDPKELL